MSEQFASRIDRGMLADKLKIITSILDRYTKSFFYLSQMRVERSTQISELTTVVGFQLNLVQLRVCFQIHLVDQSLPRVWQKFRIYPP